MNIYVETNFILELVFEQEQSTGCEQILTFCEEGRNRLIIPAYSLVEPFEKLVRQEAQRRGLASQLNSELNQLARSKVYSQDVPRVREISSLLVASIEHAKEQFNLYRNRITAIAEVVPLTAEVVHNAATYEERFFSKSPQDAVVYTSILNHLQRSGSSMNCFLNRNDKDFNNSDIARELERYSCKLIFSFDQGVAFLQAQSSR